MADAGPVEDVPRCLVDAALVANHQRDDHARIRFAVQDCQNAAAQPAPHPFHGVARIWGPPGQALVVPVDRTDVAGGADALLEQPCLVVEAVRVGIAVRALQAHDEAPALAGMHERRIGGDGAIPGQDDGRRHGRIWRVDLRHVKLEAHATGETVRQACYDTGHGDVAAFIGTRQRVAQGEMGKQRGPADAEKQAGQKTGGQRSHEPAQQRAGDDGRDRAGHKRGWRRQSRLHLDPGRASSKGKNGAAHGMGIDGQRSVNLQGAASRVRREALTVDPRAAAPARHRAPPLPARAAHDACPPGATGWGFCSHNLAASP